MTIREKKAQRIRFSLSMRTKSMILGLGLILLIVVACQSGISRLGYSDLSPRALKTAKRWTSKLGTLSQQSKQTMDDVAARVASRLQFSPYLSPEQVQMGLQFQIQEIVQNQVKDAIRERRAIWTYSEPESLSQTVYQVQCFTTLPVKVHIQYVTGSPTSSRDEKREIHRSWTVHIQLDLEIDADQRKVLAWKVGKMTHLQT